MTRSSNRQRKIDAVLDIMASPPFVCIGTGQGPAPYIVMEQQRAPELCEVADVPLDAMTTTYRERFDDKKTAIFCRNYKNAEAIILAIEAVK